MSADFNPNSPDAMFSKVLVRLEQQDMTLARIEGKMNTQLKDVDTRVGVLERDRWYQRGVVAAVSITATAVWQYMTGGGKP